MAWRKFSRVPIDLQQAELRSRNPAFHACRSSTRSDTIRCRGMDRMAGNKANGRSRRPFGSRLRTAATERYVPQPRRFYARPSENREIPLTDQLLVLATQRRDPGVVLRDRLALDLDNFEDRIAAIRRRSARIRRQLVSRRRKDRSQFRAGTRDAPARRTDCAAPKSILALPLAQAFGMPLSGAHGSSVPLVRASGRNDAVPTSARGRSLAGSWLRTRAAIRRARPDRSPRCCDGSPAHPTRTPPPTDASGRTEPRALRDPVGRMNLELELLGCRFETVRLFIHDVAESLGQFRKLSRRGRPFSSDSICPRTSSGFHTGRFDDELNDAGRNRSGWVR